MLKISSLDMNLIFTQQENSLYLGNIRAAQNIQQLKLNNICTVITVADNINISYRSIQHHIFPIQDNTKQNIIQQFEQINKVIQYGLKKGSVLIHCFAGISRSSAFVIAYLMYSQQWTYEYTYYYVKEKRMIINPNPNFKKQLIIYSNKLKQLQQQQQNIQQNITRHKSPLDLYKQLQTDIKSPRRKIDSLDLSSTNEDKEIYRFQLAQKLFANSLKMFKNIRNRQQIEESIQTDRVH